MQEDFPKALKTAIEMLGKKDYSKNQIKNKLYKKGFNDDIIDEILRFLQDKKYLDDRRYAKNYIREKFHTKGLGRLKIFQDLIESGINEELINQEISVIDDIAEKTKIIEYLNNRNTEISNQKVFNYFYRKGFSPELILEVFEGMGIVLTDD